MVETGVSTAQQAERARAQSSVAASAPHAGWFADWAAEQAQSMLPPGQDAVLHSTLDARLQSVVEARLDAMLDGPGAAAGATEGAVVVLAADTGAVRAMELDINSYWTSFITYRFPGATDPANLLSSMDRSPQRYLTPDDRDFFAVYLR